jgi:hypothetical protein
MVAEGDNVLAGVAQQARVLLNPASPGFVGEVVNHRWGLLKMPLPIAARAPGSGSSSRQWSRATMGVDADRNIAATFDDHRAARIPSLSVDRVAQCRRIRPPTE